MSTDKATENHTAGPLLGLGLSEGLGLVTERKKLSTTQRALLTAMQSGARVLVVEPGFSPDYFFLAGSQEKCTAAASALITKGYAYVGKSARGVKTLILEA